MDDNQSTSWNAGILLSETAWDFVSSHTQAQPVPDARPYLVSILGLGCEVNH